MPELEPFTFIGNIFTDDGTPEGTVDDGLVLGGFPFCPNKVDVSEFDYWVTLGGFSKDSAGSPTTTQINDSIQNAGKLYWLMYRVNATNYSTPSGTPITGEEYKIDFTDAANNENDLFSFALGSTYKATMSKPSNRGFLAQRLLTDSEFALWEVGVPYAKFPEPNGLHSNFYGDLRNPPVAPAVSQGKPIVRMYNGSTEDEDNFVGYGITSNWTTLVTAPFITEDFDYVGSGITGTYLGGPAPNAWVSLLSYANTGLDGDGEPNTIGYGEIPIAVERVETGESIPVVVCLYSLGDGAFEQADKSVSERSSTYSDSTDPTYKEGVQLDSIELYTEPA